jgi:hypothetical protein
MQNLTLRRNGFRTCALIAATFAAVPHSKAAVPIYAGPAYDSVTDTGYQNQVVPFSPGQSAGYGVGVGSASKFVAGTAIGVAAIRWNTIAATELDFLSVDGGGNSFSIANAINSTGTTVGQSERFSGDTDLGGRAVRWNAFTTAVTELGNLGTDPSGTTTSAANAINDAGAIAGYSEKYASDGSDLGQRAVRWNAGTDAATELDNLGLNLNNQTSATAVAINASGTGAGFSEKYVTGTDVGRRAVRWDSTGTAAAELGDLGTDASGFTSGEANAINSAGAVVGS